MLELQASTVTEPTATFGQSWAHDRKLSCAELFTELHLHKTHFDGSQPSFVELSLKPKLLFIKVYGEVCLSINFFSYLTLILGMYHILRITYYPCQIKHIRLIIVS